MIRHLPGCSAPDPFTFLGRYGDPIVRCRNCGQFRVGEQPPREQHTPEAPPETSRWRCREHPHLPVTWRGKGCTACDADKRNATIGKESRDDRVADLFLR